MKSEVMKLKNIKKILATIMITAMMASTVSCGMLERTPEAIAKTVYAKVGGEDITKGDVDKQLKGFLDQCKEQYGEDYENNEEVKEQLKNYRLQFLNTMVDRKVQADKAKELNLATDEEIKKGVEEGRAGFITQFGSEEALQEAMKSEGLTEEDLTKMLTETFLVSKAEEYMVKDVKVTDEEIKTYYDENKASLERKAGANVSHILVADEALAKEISEKAQNGEDFAKLAEKHGTDGTKSTGGSLGYVEYETEQMDADFMAAVKKMKEGEISAPVKSQFGYHVIKVTDVDAKGGVPSLDDAKEQIKTTIESNKKKELATSTLEAWKKEKNVKIYEDKI